MPGNIGVGNFLGELEFSWYSSRSSLPSQGQPGAVVYSLKAHKQRYFSRGSLASAGLKSLTGLEGEWLSLITGLSLTQGLQAMWASAAAQYTSATPEQGIVPNKILFYSGSTLN